MQTISEERLKELHDQALGNDRREATVTTMKPKEALELIAAARRCAELESADRNFWEAVERAEKAEAERDALKKQIDGSSIPGNSQGHPRPDATRHGGRGMISSETYVCPECGTGEPDLHGYNCSRQTNSNMTLLEKLASATEGSRELDALVTVALGPPPSDEPGRHYRPTMIDEECAPGTYWYVSISGRSLQTSEPVTTSIDAALALAERRHNPMPHIKLELVAMDLVTGGQCYWTTCELQLPEDDAPYRSRHEHEPALAICLALIKAKENDNLLRYENDRLAEMHKAEMTTADQWREKCEQLEAERDALKKQIDGSSIPGNSQGHPRNED